MNGKGSKRRPQVIPQAAFDKQWDAIFNKQKGQKPNGANKS